MGPGHESVGRLLMGFDLITVGRVTMDLHAQDIGAPFAEVSGFDTSVGGSPTNIAIGAARLGLRPIAFSAVGDDLVGDYVLRYLADAGVETRYVSRKPGKRTSLAMVAIMPPDRFPLSFYREDPADIYLTPDEAAALPFEEVPNVLISGNAFSRGSCVDAAWHCARAADRDGSTTFMDLDLRPTEWSDPADYGAALRAVLPLVDVLLGTEEEFYAALADDGAGIAAGAPLASPQREQIDALVDDLVGRGIVSIVVLKRGGRGATLVSAQGRTDVAGFVVEPVNTVGAGDSFAAGLISARSRDWDWKRAVRFANACGAITVTRHGCAVAFPTPAELSTFIDANGGL
jgi:5-dehydro-2-deoxygluconokinase